MQNIPANQHDFSPKPGSKPSSDISLTYTEITNATGTSQP